MSNREWCDEAVRRIEAENCRSADTHLIRVELGAALSRQSLYLKDESVHPTGSLKHRLARSLILYGLCNGWIGPDTTLVEASSGSTAVSEAYFARLIGLRFVAVAPRSTSPSKLDAVRRYGGEVHLVDDPRTIYGAAEDLARDCGGYYLDQFTNAERATDWRGNNNIAESIFAQMALERPSTPAWIVCGAGTGGTSATIGRYIRYRQLSTRLCVADPEHSVFHRHFADPTVRQFDGPCGSCIEGIGRPRVEPSFNPAVVDRMIAVPDAASIGAMRVLSQRLGRDVGGSTGTNLVACAELLLDMAARGEEGAVVSILCDSGDRYRATCFNDEWLAARAIDWQGHAERIDAALFQ